MTTSTQVSGINAITDVQFEVPLYAVTEPLTLEDAKTYMKVDFTDDDALITDLLTVAREGLETYTGLSFVEKTATVQLINECGGIEIPYGPTPSTIDVTLMTDIDGNVLDPSCIQIIGNQFKNIESPRVHFMQIIYTCGYAAGTLPSPLLAALKAQVFFLYTNRGERLSAGMAGSIRQYNVLYISDLAKELAKRYRRVSVG